MQTNTPLPRYRLQAYAIRDPAMPSYETPKEETTITLCRHNGDHFTFDEGFVPSITPDDYRALFVHLLEVLRKEGPITLELGD